MKIVYSLIIGVVLTVPGVTKADVLGLANGRSANLADLANTSVELGLGVTSDITTLAARFNYKAFSDVALFGDLGFTNVSPGGASESGIAFGFGGYYNFQNTPLKDTMDVSVKGSYHGTRLDIYDISEMAIETLVSGRNISKSGVGWYGNIGLHILSVEFLGFEIDDSTELSFGGGVTGRTRFGDWYAGADYIDEIFLVGGFRYKLK